MKKQAFIGLLSLFLCGFSFAEGSKTLSEDVTIFTVKENYIPAKNEPNNGIYLGAYILQDIISNANITKYNQMTGKKHASFFSYVGYGKPFPTEWVKEVKENGAVPHIAWEPNGGLDKVQDDEYLREFARKAKEADVPIFLRYASEMNGTWLDYSGDPRLYKEKWRLVHKVMKKEAPNVIMVWCVFTSPETTIPTYYPGDDYVDWVGVNIYNVVYHNDNIEAKADHEDPLNLLDYVYNQFSFKKPIQISEYGVTHYSTTDEKNHIDFAVSKLKGLYDNLPTKYPRVKAIFYFNVNNLVNAPEGRKINDYSITNEERILSNYAKAVKNDHYLSDVVPDNQNQQKTNELLSFRGPIFVKNGEVYADISFYKNNLGLAVYPIGKEVFIVNFGLKKVYSIVEETVDRGYFGYTWNIKGLPLEKVAKDFGLKYKFDKETGSIYINN